MPILRIIETLKPPLLRGFFLDLGVRMKITIDGKEYEEEALSGRAKENLQMLRLAENEIQRLNVLLAFAQTARIAYGKALNEALLEDVASNSFAFENDTISFN